MRPALYLSFWLALLAAPMVAEEIEITQSDARLQGTYLTPQTPSAVALVLPASGPTDRHGNSVQGLATDAYRLLAEALEPQGIATIRADKRGIGQSTGNPNAVTIGLYAKDAAQWIDLAKERSGLPCIWLTGHSEGGLVALELAHSRDDICGLVLLAAPGRPVSQIMLEQLRAVPALAPHQKALEKAMVSLIAGTPVPPEALPGPLAAIFAPPIQPFLMELFAIDDPTVQAQTIDLPTLVVQGTSDLQITEGDARALVEALPQGTLYMVEGMTHVLKSALDDSRTGNLATYSDPTLPLAPGLADRIGAFILGAR
ncbi:esterase EstD [Antarctobacter heliothermus]|uniref:Esterase EstD n=1 Tax=Antarctobacter heliothermus TaxID=74033 RepID=A0A222E1Z8_9RHOB|nr:alpha/beta fold hydrolase [Antarctobacter heliothermus]ASP20172.1 esterase EstD [Antarctobacter heliothermus]